MKTTDRINTKPVTLVYALEAAMLQVLVDCHRLGLRDEVNFLMEWFILRPASEDKLQEGFFVEKLHWMVSTGLRKADRVYKELAGEILPEDLSWILRYERMVWFGLYLIHVAVAHRPSLKAFYVDRFKTEGYEFNSEGYELGHPT